MSRILSFVAALMLFASVGMSGVAAQDATPAAGSNEYGLPQLDLTITDTEIQGIPAELTAGRYFVSLTVDVAPGPGEDTGFGAVGFVQLPEGRTAADLTIPAGGEATPVGAEGTPPAQGAAEAIGSPPADADPFAWLYETYVSGGPGGASGGTYAGIIELPPGNYAVWGDDPEATQAPVEVTVTGTLDTAAMTEPTAAVTIREVNIPDGFAFEIEGTLSTGTQLIKIVNESDQPHFVVSELSSEPITVEQLFAYFGSFETGTPVPGVSEEQFSAGIYAATQSAGTTQWIVADVEVGYHVVLCFVPDPTKGGIPHAFEGMAEIVPVGVDGATPTA